MENTKKAQVSMIAQRVCAQLIDFLLGVLFLFAIFGLLMPVLAQVLPSDVLRGVLGLVLFVCGYYVLQYPFMQNGQTIGKGFYHLKIVSTDEIRKDVPVAVVVQREILCKLMSCFFICVPVFFGKAGGHEEATHTKLVHSK